MKNNKTYQIFCDYCSYKRFSNGSDVDDLVLVKQSSVPRGAPFIDPLTKKVVVPKEIKRKKSFKCPNCGHLMKAKEIKIPENKDEPTDRTNGSEAGFEGQEIP